MSLACFLSHSRASTQLGAHSSSPLSASSPYLLSTPLCHPVSPRMQDLLVGGRRGQRAPIFLWHHSLHQMPPPVPRRHQSALCIWIRSDAWDPLERQDSGSGFHLVSWETPSTGSLFGYSFGLKQTPLRIIEYVFIDP